MGREERANQAESVIPATPVGLTQEQLFAAFLELQRRQVELQEQQAKATQLQEERSRPKDNPNYQVNSIFAKPSGEPYAEDLKCEIFFGPIRLKRTPLTAAEVDALNKIEPIKDAKVEKTDGSIVRVSVEPAYDSLGRLDKLTITAPMRKEDNAQHYPSLRRFAEQLAAQATVAA